MADEAAAPAANDTATPVAAPTGDVSANDAVAFLRARKAPASDTVPPSEVDDNLRRVSAAVTRAAAEESPSQDDDAEPLLEVPGETEADDEAGEPPIQPPRTWAKAEKEAFASLPREHQQSIVDRERERDDYYQRGLSEAAQKSRAAEAREQAAEQARQQYEQHLPALRDQWQNYAETLRDQFGQKWASLKSDADVAHLRETNPISWMEFRDDRDAVQSAFSTAQQAAFNAQKAEEKQRADAIKGWRQFAAEQDRAFLDKAPEFKDAKKAPILAGELRSMFADLGFTPEELTGKWEGGQPMSLRDHRVQLLVRDALRYRTAEKARKAAQPKPVPPVQRPGVATSRGEVGQAYLQKLTSQAKSSGKVDDAVALLRAKRKAS